MAVTIWRYNHTIKKVLNQEIDLEDLQVMLLNEDAAFDATDEDTTDVLDGDAAEVSGNGWTVGGVALTGVSITTVETSGAMIDATDLSVEATGGDIGPAYAAVIKDSDGVVYWYIDFGEAKTAGVGTDMRVVFNASGIARVASAA